ncbi:MAG: hypothetical protein JO147_08070 [Actinobacteria bacterium]|nr:hypothetical protein [Actinomycetota bacterium]
MTQQDQPNPEQPDAARSNPIARLEDQRRQERDERDLAVLRERAVTDEVVARLQHDT